MDGVGLPCLRTLSGLRRSGVSTVCRELGAAQEVAYTLPCNIPSSLSFAPSGLSAAFSDMVFGGHATGWSVSSQEREDLSSLGGPHL